MHLVYIFFLHDEALADRYFSLWNTPKNREAGIAIKKLRLPETPLGHARIYHVLGEMREDWKDARRVSLFSCEELDKEKALVPLFDELVWLRTTELCEKRRAPWVGLFGYHVRRFEWPMAFPEYVLISYGTTSFHLLEFFLKNATRCRDESFLDVQRGPFSAKNSMTMCTWVFDAHIRPYLEYIERIAREDENVERQLSSPCWMTVPWQERMRVYQVVLEHSIHLLLSLQGVSAHCLYFRVKAS